MAGGGDAAVMTVLLFGATGRIGSHAACALAARDVAVRALVRDPYRAAQVLSADVELIPGDFGDAASLGRALDGVDSVLLLTPHGPDMADTQLRLLGMPRHDGATCGLSGRTSPTYADIAATIEAVTGRAVPVVDITPEEMAEGARSRGASDWEVGHLAEMLARFRAGASDFVTDDVKTLL